MKHQPGHHLALRLRNRFTPVFACAALAPLAFAVFAQMSQAAEPSQLAEARQALSENIPQVAIVKLKSVLAAGTLSAGERASAQRLLAEAELDAGRASDAITTLAALSDPGDMASMLLRANALAGDGRWKEALLIFDSLSASGDAPPAAAVGKAESLQALGRTDEAVAVLAKFVESGKAPVSARLRLATLFIELGKVREARNIVGMTPPGSETDENWRRYIQARVRLLQKNPQGALAELEPLVGGPENSRAIGQTHNLFAAAKLAESEARLALQGPDAAETVLESFLRQNPDSPQIEIVFRRLDQIYGLELNPGENALASLANELPPRRAGLAQFYLSRLLLRQKLNDRAASALQVFLERYAANPDHPERPEHTLTPYVHAMLADVALARGDLAGAETALDAASRTAVTEELKGQLALRTALLNLRQGEFVRASTGFRNAAQQSPRLKQSATYNAALAWLMQKNYERFADDLKVFIAETPDPLLAGNLRVEQGLVQARSGDGGAPSVLRAFLKDFPVHPRRAEAQFAVAEFALNEGNAKEAERLVSKVSEAATSPEMLEHGEYLAIFLEDSKTPRDEDKVIALARDFISRHRASPMLAEVRMKLGQVFFRREDFLKAQEQFEFLAREQPDGTYAATALFLAGQCAVKLQSVEALNHALELFGRVADKHGPLEVNARIQQAIIKYKLGAPDDAVKIYDNILSGKPLSDPEVRFAVLTGKGDSLVALGKGDKAQLTAAMASYDEVIAAADAFPTWRNQAAYKKAKVFQQHLKQNDEALAVFYDILTKAGSGPRETFWFAKAGYDAAGIAEERQQWKTAVGIYEKMAVIPGPHAEKAKQRIKTLRLEHFLWD